MEKKVIFLDVDGTLCGHSGLVEKSSEVACLKAIENGHSLYLCTGRSKPEIFPDLMALGCKGIIGAGGAFVELEGETIYHTCIDKELVKETMEYFNSEEISYYVESNNGLYASKHCKRDMRNKVGIKENEPNIFVDVLKEDIENMDLNEVNKFCFLDNGRTPFEKINNHFKDAYEVHHCTVLAFGHNSGELAVKGVNKGKAISFLMDYTKEGTLEKIAIGDGLNDVDMFKVCDTTVAMGNAHPKLKEMAKHITSDFDKDGIKEIFTKLDII